ncbi:MAG TPA: DJ-1/PfpI family protein [Candidatus Ozemobacteraceae bacterium]|nr:DJ-1/PfpI family protein [Candidatus Ozemobacteraceae bacterium]
MRKCYVFMAHGFEEMELSITVDMLRRAKFDVQTVSLCEELSPVSGSRGIQMIPDITFKQVQEGQAEWLILPGGTEGTRRLSEDPRLLDLIRRHARAGRHIAAICAAPTILVKAGVAGDRRMTSHPSVQDQMPGVRYSTERVVVDGRFITSRAAGTSYEFAAAIITEEKGRPAVDEVNAGVLARLD